MCQARKYDGLAVATVLSPPCHGPRNDQVIAKRANSSAASIRHLCQLLPGLHSDLRLHQDQSLACRGRRCYRLFRDNLTPTQKECVTIANTPPYCYLHRVTLTSPDAVGAPPPERAPQPQPAGSRSIPDRCRALINHRSFELCHRRRDRHQRDRAGDGDLCGPRQPPRTAVRHDLQRHPRHLCRRVAHPADGVSVEPAGVRQGRLEHLRLHRRRRLVRAWHCGRTPCCCEWCDCCASCASCASCPTCVCWSAPRARACRASHRWRRRRSC